MKILKKVNLGFILTLIVLAILIAYLVGVEKQRSVDKPEIKKVCEDFIDITDKNSVLSEDLQKIGVNLTEEKLDEQEKNITEELKKISQQEDDYFGKGNVIKHGL